MGWTALASGPNVGRAEGNEIRPGGVSTSLGGYRIWSAVGWRHVAAGCSSSLRIAKGRRLMYHQASEAPHA